MRVSTRLFSRLLDDAAVFPPGLAPVRTAVTEFLARRTGQYADLIGPLLIAASAVDELVDAAGSIHPAPPLPVTLIARPGTPISTVATAVDRIRSQASGSINMTGVEVAYEPQWRDTLQWDLPVTVEVHRNPPLRDEAFADIAAAAAEGHTVRAKLRTQSTPQTSLPTATDLADFLIGSISYGLAFKLTGGLHHAVPTEVLLPGGGSELQHGLLNVLLATEAADAGAEQDHVIAALTERDTSRLTRSTARLSNRRVSAVRQHFTSYGCCGVLDPIRELTALGLLPATILETTPTDPATDSRTEDLA